MTNHHGQQDRHGDHGAQEEHRPYSRNMADAEWSRVYERQQARADYVARGLGRRA